MKIRLPGAALPAREGAQARGLNSLAGCCPGRSQLRQTLAGETDDDTPSIRPGARIDFVVAHQC
ncbi:MAG: hypothetical protein OET44_04110, partial [Gammaproteobacteria bacterium]|nr:hypothetical protein [Gammaproteobacteria bacterium]